MVLLGKFDRMRKSNTIIFEFLCAPIGTQLKLNTPTTLIIRRHRNVNHVEHKSFLNLSSRLDFTDPSRQHLQVGLLGHCPHN